jgi:hypothetical protein
VSNLLPIKCLAVVSSTGLPFAKKRRSGVRDYASVCQGYPVLLIIVACGTRNHWSIGVFCG